MLSCPILSSLATEFSKVVLLAWANVSQIQYCTGYYNWNNRKLLKTGSAVPRRIIRYHVLILLTRKKYCNLWYDVANLRNMHWNSCVCMRGKTQALFLLNPGTTMSLYDDLGVGASDTKTEGWSKNFKLLQSQLKVKKAALTQAKVGPYRPYSPLLIVTTGSGFAHSCTTCTCTSSMMHFVCLDPAHEADHCVGSCHWPKEGWLYWWETDLRHSSACCCRT